MKTKTCTKCGITKILTDFYDRHAKCKTCCSEYQKSYRKKNSEKLRKQQHFTYLMTHKEHARLTKDRHLRNQRINKLYDRVPPQVILLTNNKPYSIRISTLHSQSNCSTQKWTFPVPHDDFPYYIIYLGFLPKNPLRPYDPQPIAHIWLIPYADVSNYNTITISNTFGSLLRWSDYEIATAIS